MWRTTEGARPSGYRVTLSMMSESPGHGSECVHVCGVLVLTDGSYSLKHISAECREKLAKHRPSTVSDSMHKA